MDGILGQNQTKSKSKNKKKQRNKKCSELTKVKWPRKYKSMTDGINKIQTIDNKLVW